MKLVVVESLNEFLNYHREMVDLCGGIFAEESRISATSEYWELSHSLKENEVIIFVYDKNGKYDKTVIGSLKEINKIIEE